MGNVASIVGPTGSGKTALINDIGLFTEGLHLRYPRSQHRPIERLGTKKGDVLFGRPAWVGYPVTHVGLVMEDPDPLSGTIVWCVVGPLAARERGIEVGQYNPVAYEGIVCFTQKELQIGGRYHFLPHHCMLQSRHSAVISALARRGEGMRVRLEGIWID